MARAKSLEQQFHEAEAVVAEAQITLAKVRAEFLRERREAIRRGEDPGPFVTLDSDLWNETLSRESIWRKNAAEDKRAGLVVA